MGFEPTRAEPNGLAVHRLNHSATSSWTPFGQVSENPIYVSQYTCWKYIIDVCKKYLTRFSLLMIGVTACLVTASCWHQWFSGRMLACHAGGPGSIPGWCNIFSANVFKLFSCLALKYKFWLDCSKFPINDITKGEGHTKKLIIWNFQMNWYAPMGFPLLVNCTRIKLDLQGHNCLGF